VFKESIKYLNQAIENQN